MNSSSKWIGFGIVGFMVLWALTAGGNLLIYVDVPSVIFVVGIVVGGLWACFGPGMVVRALAASLRGRGSDRKELGRYIAVMGRGYQLAWGAGILGTVVGLVAMLADLSDPMNIGAGMAVALITVLYGAFLAEIGFNTLQQLLLNQCSPSAPVAADDTQTQMRGSRSMLGLGSTVVLLVVTILLTLLFSLSEIKTDGGFQVVTKETKQALGIEDRTIHDITSD